MAVLLLKIYIMILLRARFARKLFLITWWLCLVLCLGPFPVDWGLVVRWTCHLLIEVLLLKIYAMILHGARFARKLFLSHDGFALCSVQRLVF